MVITCLVVAATSGLCRVCCYLRKNLIHGARDVLPRLAATETRLGGWLRDLLERAHKNTVVVALANKLAHIAWSVPARGRSYKAAVVDQVRALLRQPEIVIGTWRAARKDAPDLTEGETQDALHRLRSLWEQLFPAEQAWIVRSLVERVVVSPAGADIRLRLEGLASLGRDLTAIAPSALMAAA